MDDHCWLLTSWLRHRISILWHTPLSLMRLCIDGWSLLVVYLTTSTSDIHIGAYSPFSLVRSCSGNGTSMDDHCWLFTSQLRHQIPYWGIFPSPWWDFVPAVVWGWMISVGCLPHDFDIGSYTAAYFPIFFEYPWDWDSGQLGFRLSTSLELLTIDCIRISLHGFVEIKIDHIRFHPMSMGGSFS